MCNACGFQCCADDSFTGCGCDGCTNPACWTYCDICGAPDWMCSCDEDDYEPDDYEI